MFYALCSKKCLSLPSLQRFTPKFHRGRLWFRFMIHFEVIFVSGVMEGLILIFPYGDAMIQPHLRKKTSFPP